uniref:Uncharacterized protein n=1 Tax=Arundo donax TaxID=35708 RepID=A0A0A9F472_ARUDO
MPSTIIHLDDSLLSSKFIAGSGLRNKFLLFREMKSTVQIKHLVGSRSAKPQCMRREEVVFSPPTTKKKLA